MARSNITARPTSTKQHAAEEQANTRKEPPPGWKLNVPKGMAMAEFAEWQTEQWFLPNAGYFGDEFMGRMALTIIARMHQKIALHNAERLGKNPPGQFAISMPPKMPEGAGLECLGRISVREV